MKTLKYNLIAQNENGEEIIGNETMISCYDSTYESNLALAKAEAWLGEVTVEDDGEPDPVSEPTADDILNTILGVA